MYDLIKTTYERSFDKQIISKFLNSETDNQTVAAILSIAQSEDTSFVPELLKLELTMFGSEVCFAVAQIGKCEQSINFLWNYLHSSPLPEYFPKIFFAIGKIGSESDLQKLVEFYNSFDGPIFPYEGISEAILQFQIRGIKSDDTRKILGTEATHQLSTKTRIENALFTLARYRSSSLTDEQLQILFESEYAKDDEVFRQFILMNVNRQIKIPKNVLTKLFESNSPLTKIKLVKVLHFFEVDSLISSKEILKYYLILLNDSNPNVALQTAISIKNIKEFINDSQKSLIKNKIDSQLFNSTKHLSFKGELFLSRFELFDNFYVHERLLKDIILPIKYQIRFYAKIPDKEIAYYKLAEFYFNSIELKDKIESLSQLLETKPEPKYVEDYNKVLINALTFNNAPLISIAVDGIDSLFISENSKQLKEIISNQIDKYKDNPDFLEATMSLINLSEKIDKDFYELMIEKTKTSKLYSIRKFGGDKTGNHQIGFKELDKFEDIWSYAFKYEMATIKTSKGDIVIQLNSDIAPISVANFCMLAKQNFYNEIIFHRVVPGFVIQAGDPTATGWGGSGYDIISEYSDTDFGIGYVGMASAGKDTESSQFFIMQGSHPHLDSRYSLFAKVVEGMDVVYNIAEEDKIISIELK
jgi:cyclophilin family peptidyl-prolyl cis-trans isomerase